MNNLRLPLYCATVFILCASLAVLSPTIAHANGNGRTGSSQEGCNNDATWWSPCHGGESSITTTSISAQYNAFLVAPGEQRNFTAVVAHSSQPKAGINISMRNSSNQLVSMTPGSGLKSSSTQLTHDGKRDVANGQATFDFSWTAPNSGTGTYTLYASGNAVNNQNNRQGDDWRLASPVTITVANPTIVQPAAGDKLCRGETATIRWNQSMYDGNMRVEVSTNNGSTWATVATPPGYPEFFQWQIPANFSTGTQCKIRLSHATKGIVYNVTNYTFVILPSPNITAQPQEQRVCKGQPATFSVQTDAPSLYTYQWRLNFQNIPGANSATYSIASVSEAHVGNYDCVVTGCRDVPSSTAPLLMYQPPTIVEQPENTDACQGKPLVFTVVAEGEDITYQWRFRNSPLSGKTTPTLTINALSPADTGLYDVVISGRCTPPATSLPVRASFTKPAQISKQPSDTLVCKDAELLVSAMASGKNLIYRWKRGSTILLESQSPSLTVPSVNAQTSGMYTVEIVNSCGATTTSKAFSVGMLLPVAVVNQPRDTSVLIGSTVVLKVSATGSNPTYQWQKGVSVIPGATTNELRLSNVTLADDGKYSCILRNSCSNVVSSMATVAVIEPKEGPKLTAAVSSVAFGCSPVASRVDSVITGMLKNSGEQPLVITGVTVEGSSDYSTTLSFPLTLLTDESLPVGFRYTPSQRGESSATLRFTSNSVVPNPSVALSGKGCIPLLSGSDFAFGERQLSVAHDSVLSLSNTGDYTLQINQFAITGSAAADFSVVSPSAPVEIAVGEMVEIGVRALPSAKGLRTASLDIETNLGVFSFALSSIGFEPSSVYDNQSATASGISIYPQPASSSAIVSFAHDIGLLQSVEITNSLGQRVLELRPDNQLRSLVLPLQSANGSSLPSGMYFLLIRRADGKVASCPLTVAQ